MKDLFSKIESLDFPESQYYKEEYFKNQIYLHHTASGRGVNGDFKYWLSDPARIATCVIIGWDGTIYQLYSSKFWGHHLGVKVDVFKKEDVPLFTRKSINTGKHYYANNEKLNQESIAIEIDSWGPLTKQDNQFYSWAGTKVPKENVMVYEDEFKGHLFYEKYTQEQIKSAEQLLKYWNERYKIPISYCEEDAWSVSKAALSGAPGTFTHNSVREDKTDIHPQPEFIEMWKSL